MCEHLRLSLPFRSLTKTWYCSDGKKPGALPKEMYLYDLIAVVTHEGKLENGHYWADVKSGTEWFRCDDDKSGCREAREAVNHGAHFSLGSHGDDSQCSPCSASLPVVLLTSICFVSRRGGVGFGFARDH